MKILSRVPQRQNYVTIVLSGHHLVGQFGRKGIVIVLRGFLPVLLKSVKRVRFSVASFSSLFLDMIMLNWKEVATS